MSLSTSAIVAAALLGTLLAGGPAQARPMPNGMIARALPEGGFEVRFMAGRGLPDYWCAAAAFARREYRVSDPTTRIWRASPPPRRQGQGVAFSMQPVAGNDRTGLLSIGGPEDGSTSVAFAELQCEMRRTFRYR